MPQESMARLNDTPTLSPQSQMNSLDGEMQSILNKKYAEDSEKWKMYSDTLQRYLHFASETRKPLSIEIDSKTDNTALIRDEAVRAQLAASVPKTYKSHSLRIYDYLCQSHSTVTWDASGTLSINNTVVPQSNLVDSISDLTRSRKNFAPPGTDALCQALAQMNVPLELIGNTDRRQLIQKLKGQRGGGVVEHRKLPRKVHIKKIISAKKSAIKNKKIKKVSIKNGKKYGWKTW